MFGEECYGCFVVVNGQWFVEVLPFPYDSMTVYIRVCHVKKEEEEERLTHTIC